MSDAGMPMPEASVLMPVPNFVNYHIDSERKYYLHCKKKVSDSPVPNWDVTNCIAPVV